MYDLLSEFESKPAKSKLLIIFVEAKAEIKSPSKLTHRLIMQVSSSFWMEWGGSIRGLGAGRRVWVWFGGGEDVLLFLLARGNSNDTAARHFPCLGLIIWD